MVALGVGAVLAGVGVVGSLIAGGGAAAKGAVINSAVVTGVATQVAQGGLTAVAIAGLGVAGLVVAGAELQLAEHDSESAENTASAITWDCWKAVLHEWDSPQLGGMLIEDILIDGRVRRVELLDAEKRPPAGLRIADWPELLVENVWGKRFLVHYVWVHGSGYDMPAAHCVKLAED